MDGTLAPSGGTGGGLVIRTWATMRRAAGAFALILVASGPFSGTAGYIIYFHTFGDWSVICSKDEPTDRRSCSLSAPPPAIDLSAARSQITVAEGDNGAVTISIRIGGVIVPGMPLYLRIDGDSPHQAQPNRFGETVWTGAEAVAIRDQLARGRRMVLRSFPVSNDPADTGKPRDEMISLSGFDEALKTYRANLQAYGVTGAH